MNQKITKGIILSRTVYGEADRIITVLTPDYGKIRLMARGVRRVKSKLAGGIELFSVSDLTYIEGKGDLGTLISSRLDKYYSDIVKDLDRVQMGYELIKLLNRATEDHPEPAYFMLLEQAYAALNDPDVKLDLINVWFKAQIIKQAGHMPNFNTDNAGEKLLPDKKYNFDYDAMALSPVDHGSFGSSHIKTLRLLFSNYPPRDLQKVQGTESLIPPLSRMVQPILLSYIRT